MAALVSDLLWALAYYGASFFLFCGDVFPPASDEPKAPHRLQRSGKGSKKSHL